MDEVDELREQVRARYAAVAAGVGGCGGPTDRSAPAAADGCCRSGEPAPRPGTALPLEEHDRFGAGRYRTSLTGLPVTAVSASLGCGDPTSVALLHPGEVVLDLGSGAGLDVLLSARRVGPTGHAYGLDMTEEMLALARSNAAAAGAGNVTFLAGEMEAIPLPDASVDVVVSNCVINLSTDKDAVFNELSRVVRPGGRLAISDVVAEDHLTGEQRAEQGSFVGCIAGALSFAEYRTALAAAGFTDIDVTPTHEVAVGMHAAVVRGRR